MIRFTLSAALLVFAACGFALLPAAAQESSAPPAAPAPPAQPSLDELLNIPAPRKPTPPQAGPEKPAPAGAEGPGTPTQPAAPKIEIAKEKPGDLFVAAVAEMKLAAHKLTAESDPGIDTQRTQESAIRKLDQLIDQLRQQQKQKSKSKSKKQDTGSQKNQAQQQQGEQQQQGNQESQESRDTADRMMGLEDGQRADVPLAEKLAEWGNLPDRIRDQLMQGSDDQYSRLYQQLTERYYRRLAEEAP